MGILRMPAVYMQPNAPSLAGDLEVCVSSDVRALIGPFISQTVPGVGSCGLLAWEETPVPDFPASMYTGNK